MKKYLIFICFIFTSICLAQAETTFQVYFQDQDKYKDVIVSHVISTDTLQLKSGERIRLIGLRASDNLKKRKAVEYDRDGKPVETEEDEEDIAITPIEEEALKYTQDLLEGKHVRLEFDDLKKTDDFATFAYVYLLDTNTMVNIEILKHGYAYLQIIPPNMKYAEDLRAAYRESRSERRGLQNE